MADGGIQTSGPVRSVATSAVDGSLFLTTNAPPERVSAQISYAIVGSFFLLYAAPSISSRPFQPSSLQSSGDVSRKRLCPPLPDHLLNEPP